MTTTLPSIQTLEDLKHLPQWVCFNKDKVPFNPSTGKGADCNQATTWGSYEAARHAWSKKRSWYAGVGFELVKEQGITGVDLDKCVIDGKISAYAQEIIAVLDSYTEYSPSGTGIHIWVRGNIPSNLPANDDDGNRRTEMYDHERYFTVTGRHVEGTPNVIEDRQEELLIIYQEVVERRQRKPALLRPVRTSMPSTGDTPYGLAALREECQELATTSEGSRNQRLNNAAFSMGQLIAGNELTRSTVERELSAAAERAGLPDREIEKTMDRAIEAGMQEPRSKPKESGSHHQPIPTSTRDNETTNSPIDLCSFTADDAGNGDALFALFGKQFLWCSSRGWFAYTDTHWMLDTDGAEVKKRAVETLRKRRHAAVDAGIEAVIKCTKGDDGRVNGCVNRFKTLVSISIDAFDSNPNLLNCKNGVVDLRTGVLSPHTNSQRFTYCLPVEYERADASEWTEYLNGIVGGGQEVIDYLQMALGYSLTGHTREEILFYLFGPTRSGKGTLAETFMALLPDPISTMVDFNSFTAKREGDVSNFDLAPLKPSRMIFASESNRSQSLNPAKIKQLTGGDQVRACFKHRDFFSYRPQFKVWMMSNHPVNGDPEDDALWGRVRVIEFPNSFLGKEDKTKKARLKEPDVLKGILYWSVQGAIRWHSLGAAGLTTPEAIAKTTTAQRAELDYVQQWLDECTDESDEGWAPNEVVTASYLAWCKDNNVQYPKGPKALAQSLKAKGYQVSQQKSINGKNRRGVGGLHIYEIEANT